MHCNSSESRSKARSQSAATVARFEQTTAHCDGMSELSISWARVMDVKARIKAAMEVFMVAVAVDGKGVVGR